MTDSVATEPLPYFPYHPDPLATGSVVSSDIECVCCARRHGYTWGPDGLLFSNITRTGFLYPEYWYQKVWMPSLSGAELKYLRSHSLRHFYASSLLAQGVPMTEVSAWLGHSSVEFTEEYYAHLMPDAPDRARLAIDAALAPVQPHVEEVDLEPGEEVGVIADRGRNSGSASAVCRLCR